MSVGAKSLSNASMESNTLAVSRDISSIISTRIFRNQFCFLGLFRKIRMRSSIANFQCGGAPNNEYIVVLSKLRAAWFVRAHVAIIGNPPRRVCTSEITCLKRNDSATVLSSTLKIFSRRNSEAH